ncbi:MAG TPA: RNA polymerase sigma factor, partial [Polyangiales bacterium]|nr:RNA polymerase sigma factor [Polyangiales bacterium]
AHVARWTVALGANRADIDDIVQDVFVVVHRRLSDFNGDNVAGWLYQIVRRKVSEHRRLTWIKHIFRAGSELHVELPLPTLDAYDQLDLKEQRLLLDRLLDKLKPEYRAAFLMFEMLGYSGEEISEVQSVCINTVWARIHTARKRLKGEIARLERSGRFRTS